MQGGRLSDEEKIPPAKTLFIRSRNAHTPHLINVFRQKKWNQADFFPKDFVFQEQFCLCESLAKLC